MPHLPSFPRRRFVQGLTSGGLLLGLGALAQPLLARTGTGAPATSAAPAILRGTEFDLAIGNLPVNFTGRPRTATAVNGSVPAPVLRWREGDTVTLRVSNHLAEDTSIHWHGILLPNDMDGVPGLTFDGIRPGETFTYRFPVRQSGTYWYHSHSGMQEQTGLYGAIIIDPATPDPVRAERDHVILLSDWTDEDPMAVLRHLRIESDYYNNARPTLHDFLRDARRMGWTDAIELREMWNTMRMSPTDFADVSAATYTYLMNGTPPAGNWQALFTPGERVRLRFINGAANSFFDVRIPGLGLTVVTADGQPVLPVEVDEFRFGPGETYDIIVQPKEDRAYTIFAQSMDRSGYARGTLCPRPEMEAEVPAIDAPQWLSMDDMMGSMEDDAPHAHHAWSEFGPAVDNRIDRPRTDLDDPGVNLRDNGRRVLTLADLHSPGGDPDPRPPEREIELHLTGNMQRYTWSVDGIEYGHAQPIRFRYGERLRVVLVNDTMMTHPFHLHGLWSDVETPQGEFLVRRHTVPVQPAQRVSYRVTADAMGRWAYHCHLMFHMATGMFREVRVL
ncbi:MAG: copper resistance system multicopper oxidase [Proteobacteria bacterium]|nr:copper resistance system multicopper oxidase [Pseudomonadota bacterium]HQR04227.1 copper resistance system multicopper oxidase [Rhodocyclaceae bacterium]